MAPDFVIFDEITAPDLCPVCGAYWQCEHPRGLGQEGIVEPIHRLDQSIAKSVLADFLDLGIGGGRGPLGSYGKSVLDNDLMRQSFKSWMEPDPSGKPLRLPGDIQFPGPRVY